MIILFVGNTAVHISSRLALANKQIEKVNHSGFNPSIFAILQNNNTESFFLSSTIEESCPVWVCDMVIGWGQF